MIWIIVIVILSYIGFKFFSSLNQDNYELESVSLKDKFAYLVEELNQNVYLGRAKITVLDKRTMNLYEKNSNQIINFFYTTGNLVITWKYKYFQKELVFEKTFNNVRNLSIFEQQKLAGVLMDEMFPKIEEHQLRVSNGF